MSQAIVAIPIFTDNYVWTIIHQDEQHAVVVDPGKAQPVIDYLNDNQLKLKAILITHYHWDHVGGVSELSEKFQVPVYGPAAENIPAMTNPLSEADNLELFGVEYTVIEVPGHTLGHIAYYSPAGILFCGDTLFSGGCGRLFEGTPQQMYHALQRLARLPADTLIYCTHEYTLSNLKFAAKVEPKNTDITDYAKLVQQKINDNKPSLPSTLAQELKVNPFLRCDKSSVIQAALEQSGQELTNPVDVFAVIRHWKDNT